MLVPLWVLTKRVSLYFSPWTFCFKTKQIQQHQISGKWENVVEEETEVATLFCFIKRKCRLSRDNKNDFCFLKLSILKLAYLNLMAQNSVASQRRTENKVISILLLVETSLILSKVIQNLITNLSRTRSFIY
jgi:hypothetical protein